MTGVDVSSGMRIEPVTNCADTLCPGCRVASQAVATPLRGRFSFVRYRTTATSSSTRRSLPDLRQLLAMENWRGLISGKTSVMYSSGTTADLNSCRTSWMVRRGRVV